MTSSPPPGDPPASEFELALQEVEGNLQSLKQRYTQIQTDLQRQEQLQASLSQTQLGAELERIKKDLAEIQVALESQLLTERHLMVLFWQAVRHQLLGDVFWQAVRLGGLGVILGWLLKSCAGS